MGVVCETVWSHRVSYDGVKKERYITDTFVNTAGTEWRLHFNGSFRAGNSAYYLLMCLFFFLLRGILCCVFLDLAAFGIADRETLC